MQDTTPGDAARGFSFVLARRAGGLELQAPHHPGFKPIRCDWTDAEMSRRVAAGKQQLLARAIGLHKYKDLSVLDATAGLGRDGFVLAALGAQVTMVERPELSSEERRVGKACVMTCTSGWAPTHQNKKTQKQKNKH